MEKRLQAFCRRAIKDGIALSAHDCSDGGLAVALAECCIQGGFGFRGALDIPSRWDAALFGERQSRIVVSLTEADWPALERLAAGFQVPVSQLGNTGGDRFQLGPALDLPLQEISDAWRHGLERAL